MRQRAVIQAAQRSGMGVSEVVIKDQIKQAFTQDKQFNAQGFNAYLANFGFTQATLLQQESESYIVRQLLSGLSETAFITQQDLELLAGIVGQKRTFSAITIPKEKAAKVTPAKRKLLSTIRITKAASVNLRRYRFSTWRLLWPSWLRAKRLVKKT